MFKLEDGSGLPDATSYIDDTYATEYIDTYFPEDTEWATKSQPEKELLLMTATAFVDRLVNWKGRVYNAYQALSWPRTAITDLEGRVIPSGTIPEKVKDAVAIMALESLSADIYDEGVLVTSMKYGSSSEFYAGPVRDGGNFYATRLLKDFKRLGYGQSYTSQVILERA